MLSMAIKKDFTKADKAIDKFFAHQENVKTAQDTDITKTGQYAYNEELTEEDNYADITNTQTSVESNHTNTTQHANNTNNADNTKNANIANSDNVCKVTNKSKHYDERGKRAERFGLLLDERLKGDLTHLSKAKGSKSVNDLIITILIQYVELEENQIKLEQYRRLLQE